MSLFGQRKSIKDIVREQKRNVERTIRSLEREKQGMVNTEKKLIADIKKAAKENQISAVKIMAKDLVRVRKHQTKFVNLTAQLRAMSLQMTEVSSSQVLAQSMNNITRSMMIMNAQVNMPQMQKIVQEFQKQSEMMEMKTEMVGDAMDDAMADENTEDEENQVVNQVLDEIGIDVKESLATAPQGHIAKKQAEDEKKLEERYKNI